MLGRDKFHLLIDIVDARAKVRGMSEMWFKRNHSLYRDSTRTKLGELIDMGLAETDGAGHRIMEKKNGGHAESAESAASSG